MSKNKLPHLKHIKKKTFNKSVLNDNFINAIMPNSIPVEKLSDLKPKETRNKSLLIINDDDTISNGFFYNYNSQSCSIPLANPVLIYFNHAQLSLKPIEQAKLQILKQFKSDEKITEQVLFDFYHFFGLSSSYIVMLTTAMEAFVNQKIPPQHVYEEKEQNRYTKSYTYEQIQHQLTLDKKIQKILATVYGKNFSKKYPLKQQHIENLKQLRNDIIHTKMGESLEKYEELYKKALDFKYLETIYAVYDFINFYEDNLIEPCPCDNEDL